MRSPEEFFVTAKDGTTLFYERWGNPDGRVLVPLDGVLWDGTIWRYLTEYFADSYQFVHPHYRGHGRSGTPSNLERATIVDVAEDIATVLQHAGVDTACLIGHSMGVQVALEYWHLHSETIEAMVLVNGTYGRVLDTFHDTGILKLLFPSLRRALNKSPQAHAVWKWVPAELALRVAMLTGDINSRVIRRRDMLPYLKNARYVDLAFFLNVIQSLDRHDSWSFLPDIDVPTLVVAAEKDTFTPPRQAQRLAARIPESEFLMMRGATHAAPLEHPDLLNLRVEKFLLDRLA